MTEAIPNIQCPSCGSQRIWKNGFKFGVQTYLCRDCSRRFNAHACMKDINVFAPIIGNVKSASPLKDGAKNLTSVEPRTEALARGTTLTEAELKGKLIEFMWWMKKQKENYKEETIRTRVRMLRTLHNCGANLFDPESVVLTIRMQEWRNGTKANAIIAYRTFAKAFNIPVGELPKYDRTPRLPFIPTESEIDQLIAGCSKKVGTFLQTLKETGARCGEALRLEWTDINAEHDVITINNPEKRGLPRQMKVSSKLISMVQALPKTSKHVFGEGKPICLYNNFVYQRKRIAKKLQNPRIGRIHFHTLRHFYGTMEYHRTKDILHVKEKLGHKSITSTLVYTHLVNFESDEYVTRRTKDINEAEELLKAGFEYVTDMDEHKLFRKRK